MKLVRQDTASGIRDGYDSPPTPLTADEREAFSETMGTFPQNVTFTPDFPRSAELISGMYRASAGTAVDGVVSVDPVALSYLLRGTGPIDTAGGRTLDAQNVVAALLSKVYAEFPDDERQNDYFRNVARTVFDEVVAGGGDPRTLLENLIEGVSERRIQVWSRRPAEQQLIAPTALGGSLPAPSKTTPQLGVYFNSSRPSKLEYYLDYDVSVAQNSCQVRQQDLTLSVKMRSRVPRDVAGLPDYVAGKYKGFKRGTMFFTVFVFVPDGSEVKSLTTGGEKDPFTVRELYGRSYVVRTVALAQGKSSTLQVRLLAPQGLTRTPELRVTPGVRSDGVGEIEPAACSSSQG